MLPAALLSLTALGWPAKQAHMIVCFFFVAVFLPFFFSVTLCQEAKRGLHPLTTRYPPSTFAQ